MRSTILTLLAIPALALAQSTTSAPAAASIPSSTNTARAKCASDDGFCINTAVGWNSAAASYLAAERTGDPNFKKFQTELFAVASKVGSTGSLAAEAAKATSGPEIAAFAQDHNSLMADADRAPVSSILAHALSLQSAGVAQPTGGMKGNGTTLMPSATGGLSGGAGGAAPSGVSLGAASRPTDVAFMAMAGAVAGIAGIAYGL